MSRVFSMNRPTLQCDQERCYNRTTIDTGVSYPEEPEPKGLRLRWSEKDRVAYEAAQNRAWRALEATPTPTGWFKLINGSEIYAAEDRTPRNPEFCSLRCVRLWVTAHERQLNRVNRDDLGLG